MERQINLKVEEKEFKNKQGESISYYSCTADVNGTKIHFKPIDEDKSLFKYLMTINE